jgi:YD repeat-containing protein
MILAASPGVTIVRTSSAPIVYQRRLPDGSLEEFAQPEGSLVYPRKVFLTRLVDAAGNAVQFTYDASLRLVAVTDAIGQVTTLDYGLAEDALKVTRVTDPFGRYAQFEYTAGRLVKIRDVMGIESQFEYAADDFIRSLITPYGKTSFRMNAEGRDRWIEATDPLGGTERVDYRNFTSALPDAEPLAPTGFPNTFLRYRNTLYWSKTAFAKAPGDASQAEVLHWLHTSDGSMTSGILESEKLPLEGRVSYAYPGQPRPYDAGSDSRPIKVARILDDGSTQLYQYEHNTRGKRTKEIDPLGRETVYVYGTNNVPDSSPATGQGMDLLQLKRKNGVSYETLTSYTNNDKHQPLTVTDARGAVTVYTYNTAGQVLTLTPPPVQGQSQGPTTSFTYDANGRLEAVNGPVPAANASFTYDTHGRRRTATDAAGLTVTYDYDEFDRVTKVTYPDTTYEETVYKWLDVERRRDRLGRWTYSFYDSLRRVVAMRDAAEATTLYQYGSFGCASCGARGDRLTRLIDASGHATSWDYDVQGRVTKETRANGAFESYTYEMNSSRLAQKTDRRDTTTTFEYFLDGKLKRKSYSDSTPPVSYTYDPVDGQMLTAANGTDTLTWTYDELDRVATEASAKNASTVGYTYDDAGNRLSLSLDGATHVTYGYDPQSRLTTITRGSNVFEFGYDTASRRTSMTYPNGVVTSYEYDSESRLTLIAASRNGTPITSFSYALDAVGNRTRKTTLDWTEDYGYDDLNRLVSADRSSSTPSRWRWAYDAVGNRTTEQVDDAAIGATHNNLNQLLSRQPGGALVFRGSTNEPAAVTVAGQPAQAAADNSFTSPAAVGAGLTDVAVTATDPSGNARTNTDRVSASGAATTYTYDPNGNLASKVEGTDSWVYTWNAENQLTKVEKNGVEQARFAYDPMGRRVEKVAGGVTTAYAYEGSNVLRETRGGTTIRYVHGRLVDEPLAVEDGASVTYLHADGLGSIVKGTSVTGAVVLARGYDAWGNPEVGAAQAGYAFTGRE